MKGLREETGLLLDFGKIIEILSFGGFEGDGLGKIVDGILSVAVLSVNGSKGTSNFGIVGVEMEGLGEIGDDLGSKLRLGSKDTVVDSTPLEKTTIVGREKLNGFSGG